MPQNSGVANPSRFFRKLHSNKAGGVCVGGGGAGTEGVAIRGGEQMAAGRQGVAVMDSIGQAQGSIEYGYCYAGAQHSMCVDVSHYQQAQLQPRTVDQLSPRHF